MAPGGVCVGGLCVLLVPPEPVSPAAAVGVVTPEPEVAPVGVPVADGSAVAPLPVLVLPRSLLLLRVVVADSALALRFSPPTVLPACVFWMGDVGAC